MAIFHLTVKSVSRGKGQIAVAKAAYNAREKLLDERTDQTKDYTSQGEVLFSAIFAPKDAPEWVNDRAALWNAAERAERRKDAQLALEIEVALPHELTDEQRKWLVTDFVREQFTRKGMVADVNIHPPPREPEEGKQPNHHAHILVALREAEPDGFGKRICNSQSFESNAHQVEQWREKWEQTVNRHLERHGLEERIDRRTLEEQGIDREPTTHRGPTVDAMERRGIETERGEMHEAEIAPTVQGIRLGMQPEPPTPIDNWEREAQWWQRIEDAIERGAGGDEARQRQRESEQPEGLVARLNSAATFEQMRELRTELVGMRQEIASQLRDPTLSNEYRSALRDIGSELRGLHHETSKEIAALRLEQGDYEPKIIELGRERLNEFVENIGGKAADLVGGFMEMAGKLVDGLVDFFITPSRPTPEQIHAQIEAKEEKQQAAIDGKRYDADSGYRQQVNEQERQRREKDAAEYYKRGKEREPER
jgi:MobA/MobL family